VADNIDAQWIHTRMYIFVLKLVFFSYLGCGIFSSGQDVPIETGTNPCFALDAIDCFDCLAEDNPEGYQQYQESILSSCYCGSECGSLCENFCDDMGSIEEECAHCFDIVSQDPQSFCIFDVLGQCEQEEVCTDFVFMIQECDL